MTTRCVACGFLSDDPDEAVAHLTKGHHPKGCNCGPCQVVYGYSHQTPIDDWAIQVDCWTEAA